jgi:hypothetical protein
MPVFNYKALPSGDILTIIAPSEAVAASDVGSPGVDYDPTYGFVFIAADEAQNLGLLSLSTTGVLSGLEITAASATEIFVGNGTAQIADYSVTDSPTITPVVWNDNATPIAITNIAAESVTLIGINGSREITQIDIGSITETFRRNNAIVGSVSHTGGAINNIVNANIAPYETGMQFIDFLSAIGVVNLAGFGITPTITGFSVASGFLMSPGSGVAQGNRSENTVAIDAQVTASFSEFLGTTGQIVTSSTTTMDVINYDDGGVLTAIPAAGQAVIKYLFMFPANPADLSGQNIAIMHGQNVYANVDDAKINAESDLENIVVPDLYANRTLLLSRWIVEDGADLTNPLESQLLRGALFGTRIGAGGSSAGSGTGGDVFGPAGSELNEIPAYADASGKVIKSDSDMTLLAGVFQRILPSGGVDIRTGDGVSGLSLANDGRAEIEGGSPTVALSESGVSKAEFVVNSGTMQLGITGFTDLAHLNFEFGFATMFGGPVGWSRLQAGLAEVRADGTSGNVTINDNTFGQGDAFIYPAADGLAGDVMTTDAAGNITFDSPSYSVITTDTTLDYDIKFAYVDASAGPVVLTLGDNPRSGERKRIYIADKSNDITLVSANPAFPINPPPQIGEGNIQGQWTLASDFLDRYAPTDRDLTNSGTGGVFDPVTVNGNAVNAFNFQKSAYLEAVASAYKGVTGSSARSFVCWYGANAGQPVDDETIVAWGEDIPPGGLLWEIDFRSSQSYLWVNNRNASRRWNYSTLAPTGLWDGNMHHIAVTQSTANMGSISLYIDGVKIAHDFQDTFPTCTTSSNTNFRIGANYSGGTRLNAKLYDCRLFNRGLSLTEVTDIINEDLQGGVNLTPADDHMVFDVVYNDTEWTLGVGTESLSLTNRERLDVIEAEILRKPSDSLDQEIVTYAGTDGSQADNGSNVTCVDGVFTKINTLTNTISFVSDGSVSVDTTTAAFFPPRLTTAQRVAVTPAAGAFVFDSNIGIHYSGDGVAWNPITGTTSLAARTVVQNNIPLAGIFQGINTGTFDYFDVNGSPATPNFTAGVWTVPATGVYLYNIRGLPFTGTGVDNQIRMYIRVNGLEYSDVGWIGIEQFVENGNSMNLSGAIKHTAGDTVQIAYSVLSGTGWELDIFEWDVSRQS